MVATPGRRLGRYHLVEPIGAGPCGEVYRAKVVGVAGMERQLAIKRFYPEVLAMPDASQRLQQASRSYGGLDHPRVARLSELGVAGGETFTAVELVPGLDVGRLRQMAVDSGEPLPSGGVLALLSAAARAVGYAHGRGVCHWGIGPGNVIATPDGDVKVTDFGVLTCRLPARPSSDESLVLRLPYLAPEQLLGEPLSAASDVFSLGVLTYELIGGARPFTGANAAEIEQAIVSGRPAPLELPRPIARVIDRCLARSPFERFPDARSLADALDAALRLSPLTGTKRDVGDRVRVALEHLARINEQQLSGALSFSVPTPPPRPPRPPLGGLPLPPPMTTLTGTPPPPPAPERLPAPPRPFRASSSPPLVAPPTRPGDDPPLSRSGRLRVETDLSVGDETGRIEPLWPPTEPVPLVRADGSPLAGPARPAGPSPFDAARSSPDAPRPTTPQFSASILETARSQPSPFASSSPPAFGPSSTTRGVTPAAPPPSRGGPSSGASASGGGAPPPSSRGGSPSGASSSGGGSPPPSSSRGGATSPPFGARAAPQSLPPAFGSAAQPPPLVSPGYPSRPSLGAPPPPLLVDVPVRRRWRTVGLVVLAVAVVAAAAAGGFFLVRPTHPNAIAGLDADGAVALATGPDAAQAATGDATTGGAVRGDARVVGLVDAGAIEVAIDAAAAEVAIDAGAAAAIDAGAATDAAAPRSAADKLTITSTPSGAQVFLDGAAQGKTPVVVPASADDYALAIYAPGRALYLATIPGAGSHDAALVEIPPPTGKGGIKVRCHTGGRYYVFIDGKPTGELCPTERIPASVGTHTVEIYDLVTETRRSAPVRIVQVSRSTRVRMD